MAIAKAEIEAERAQEQKEASFNDNGYNNGAAAAPTEGQHYAQSQAENGYAQSAPNGYGPGPMQGSQQYGKSAPPPVPPRPNY